MASNEYAKIAKEYYNSAAHDIYLECWGGENHHLGLFDNTDDFYEAADKANENLLRKLQIQEGDKVIDIGSGFCGLPRYIAKNTKCEKVVALNISEKENEYARNKNKEEGLGDKIDVYEGDFNNMPFDDGEFDIMVSQDAMLHSPDKADLLRECNRVLKKGGTFVFSDILQMPELTQEEAEKVYDRVNVPDLGTFEFYKEKLKDAGFEVVEVIEYGSSNLGKSYKSVHDILDEKKDYLINDRNLPEEPINNALQGLKYWVEKASEGKINWGLFVAKKK
ncbi:class I SAM-dependent methyltransferase [Natranaerofaba carboxydovora]|uniref:class I SAM-dependent methyltransferase n=1 Tax=Natranaerofaba carboxydovora TaxID=2742683 RepID=UPI001F12D852|nr:class I SAM-dependent methyltransferase [Natranaerofaba carboxydovora]UMZ72633.1 Sarcosine/dimethylglycine N-methyltransferase [Natranaerofaba carboxydovora]